MGGQFSHAALRQYQSAAVARAVTDVKPEALIDMLLAGALDKLSTARGAMQRGEAEAKGQLIGGVIAIVDHLRLCLDHGAGGRLSANLEALYDYINRRLLQASAGNDVRGIEEAMDLLRTLKSAWEKLPPQRAPAARAAAI
jgi:flagellar protein FliS